MNILGWLNDKLLPRRCKIGLKSGRALVLYPTAEGLQKLVEAHQQASTNIWVKVFSHAPWSPIVKLVQVLNTDIEYLEW